MSSNLSQLLLQDDDNWIPDEELNDSNRARISALKVLVNRCIAYADSPEAGKVSSPIFKLLWQLMLREKIGPTVHRLEILIDLFIESPEKAFDSTRRF